jgi:hypothetical protein
MIEFLKDSTFAVNDVLQTAWNILKKQYLSIAGLCFLLFITWNSSAFLAAYLAGVNVALSLFMALIFILVYFTVQLTLFKYTLKLIDVGGEDTSIKNSLPSKKQLANFLIGTFYFFLCILFVYLLMAILVFPLIYTGLDFQLLIQVATSLGIIAIFITWIRISFFPFFIIDMDAKPFRSIRFSLAITRGNFTRLLLLLGTLALFHGMSFYLIKQDYPILGALVSIISSFFIVPLSGVATAVAYRQMMGEYKGDQDPDIIHNII